MVHTTSAFAAFLIALFVVPLCFELRAEEPARWQFGVSAGAGVQFHSSGFTSLPPILLPPAAEPFTTAVGPSFSLGLDARYRVLPVMFLGLGVDVSSWSGSFSADEPTFFVIQGVGTPGVITHDLDVALTSIGITPSIAVPVFSSLTVDAGVRMVAAVAANSYEHTETITQPANIPFLDGGGTRITGRGDIGDVKRFALSLDAGIRYNIPLAKSLSLAPEARFRYAFTSLTSSVHWNFTGIQGGLALVFAPNSQPPVLLRDTVYQRDTMNVLTKNLDAEKVTLLVANSREQRVEKEGLIIITTEIDEQYRREIPKPAPLLATAVDVKFVGKNGEETAATTISIEELVEKRYVPLLPLVFFAENSSVLPSKYQKNRRDTLSVPKTLGIYYRLLDTVGSRMGQFRTASLTLTGTNANTGEEQDNLALSRRRAEAVRDYLVQEWNIPSGRITLRERNLPENFSVSAREASREESRRVELAASDKHILAPVILADTTIIADPPLVRFYPDVVSEAGIDSWSLNVSTPSRVARTFSGKGQPPIAVEWDIASTPHAASLLTDTVPMYYTFEAVDAEHTRSRTEPGTIRFEEVKRNTQQVATLRSAERFSLILFDYNTAELTTENKETVEQIRHHLSPQQRVSVVGSTDVTGDEEYNRTLARRRAEAIARLLNIPAKNVRGIGVDAESFPQNVPEGRLYSRRVDVLLLPE